MYAGVYICICENVKQVAFMTSGHDQQICPGTFPSSWPFVKNLSRTIVQGHPRNGRTTRTRSRRPRRRPRQARMNGIMPSANHHHGHGNNQRSGLRLHLHPGKNGARTKRVSVLIGNHQPTGAAQTKRVSVLDCDHRVPGSRRSHGSEEWGPHQRGHLQGHSWRRKKVWFWRANIFSSFLPIVLFCCERCERLLWPAFMPEACRLCGMLCWCLLAQGQPVSLHSWEVIGVLSVEKWELIESILAIIIFLTLCQWRSREEKAVFTVFRHVRSTQKAQVHSALLGVAPRIAWVPSLAWLAMNRV